MRTLRQWLLVALFAVAMAWVEAAAVMYLRLPADRVQPYQANPLPTLPALGPIELVRELATLVMLASMAALAGRDWLSRFGFFLIAFGGWDLGYYAFLRWMGGWPASLLDWDILFLLPLPWWGPVWAPVSISLVMLTLGTLLTHPRSNRLGRDLSPLAWAGAACGAVCAIGIFIWDAAQALPDGIQAVLNVLPQQFLWPQFLAAFSLMTIPAIVLGWRLISHAHSPERTTADAPPSPAPTRRRAMTISAPRVVPPPASPAPIPARHVGIIMDGNGRWALARGLPRSAGHRVGVENVRTVVEASVEAGVRHLTLYAFSTENWERPAEEVRNLLGLIDLYLERELNALHRNGVRLRHLGSLDGLAPGTRRRVERAIQRTADNTRLHLNIAFNYGGRAEIVQAARRLVRSNLTPDQVTEAEVAACLDTAGQPDLDLVIRTGGEMRLSNFLLWQAAYAEIYVTQAYWPDFDRQEFGRALESYASRQRRFGKAPPVTQASAA